MMIGTPQTDAAPTGSASATLKSRDADGTRRLLLNAALLRFARDGYGSTTVRDIAGDAGVNVALINRYFTSKEGLFEACLNSASEEIGRTDAAQRSPDTLLAGLVGRVAAAADSGHSLQLLLLLRSSGDERADSIRRTTLEYFATRMVGALGGDVRDDPGNELVLRAQIVIAAALGMTLLRASSGIEPLSSATESDLSGPLADLVGALLNPPKGHAQ